MTKDDRKLFEPRDRLHKSLTALARDAFEGGYSKEG